MSNVVKYFHSGMLGAPVLTGLAGSLISVLDGCLVNGWGSQVATSVVIAGGVATVTLPSSHPFEVDTVALISGASPAGLNGEFKLTAIGANTVSFPTALPDQTATGTITVKLAPLGWTKPFTATNIAAYRTGDVDGVRAFLRVDDSTLGFDARVVGYESMSDINTGACPFPTPMQLALGGFWPKANSANATTRAWTLVGDGKTFYIHLHASDSNKGVAGAVWSFGEFSPVRSGDAYRTILFSSLSQGSGTSATVPEQAVEYNSIGGTGAYVQRPYSGIGTSRACSHSSEANTGSSSYISGIAGMYAYPNAPDNSLLLSRKQLTEGVHMRGFLRGVSVTLQSCHAAFSQYDKVLGAGAMSGRKLLAVKCGAIGGTISSGVVFFDVTGPWE